MGLAELVREFLPAGVELKTTGGVARGLGRLQSPSGTTAVHLLGVVDGTALGVEQALMLGGHALEIAHSHDDTPILLLLDCGSQRMTRRDELLGLNEYLTHVAKSLMLAERAGHRTLGLLYGHAAAGAFIVTGLATSVLVAVPGATPEVMDLPSMARVTKLPLELLQSKAQTTSVFAPGLENLSRTGAVCATLLIDRPLGPQIAALLGEPVGGDKRDQLGAQRGGRPKAADIAARIAALLGDV